MAIEDIPHDSLEYLNTNLLKIGIEMHPKIMLSERRWNTRGVENSVHIKHTQKWR